MDDAGRVRPGDATNGVGTYRIGGSGIGYDVGMPPLKATLMKKCIDCAFAS